MNDSRASYVIKLGGVTDVDFRAISGLGRIGGGGGLVSDFEHHHHVVHMGLGRASWQGAQGHCPPLRRPLCPSWRAGFRADPHEIGRFEGIGPDLWELGAASTRAERRPRAGHCRRLWERLWGRRLELGANTYRVLVHPTSTERALVVLYSTPRGRGPPCAGGHGRLAEAGSVQVKLIKQTFIRRLRQSQRIVQLAAGQQPGVRGDGSAVKLQPYTAVETELGAGAGAFTHRVPPEWVRNQELE